MDERATFMDKNPKDKGGRPSHQPTPKDRRIVDLLSGFGLPQDKIAHVVGFGLMTLRKHYREELDAGAAKVEAQLIGNLFARSRIGQRGVAGHHVFAHPLGWSSMLRGQEGAAQLDARPGLTQIAIGTI